jgi:uncharacterized membrane protein YkvA (DUF1232 family)
MRFFRMLGALRATIPRVLPMMRDPRVPFWLKAGTLAGTAFIISPVNLLGDIPVVGVVDDIALLSLLAMVFVKLASAQAEGGEPEPELKTVHPL